MGKVEPDGLQQHALDVRLHAPSPDVVVVWVDGCLAAETTGVLVERVGQQLTRALVVILDLGHLQAIDDHAIATVRRLQVQAYAAGVQLHLATECAQVRDALEVAGLHRSRPIDATAAAVTARLPLDRDGSAIPAKVDGVPDDAAQSTRWRREVTRSLAIRVDA